MDRPLTTKNIKFSVVVPFSVDFFALRLVPAAGASDGFCRTSCSPVAPARHKLSKIGISPRQTQSDRFPAIRQLPVAEPSRAQPF